jgi:cyclic dehypoxanthinyl futalosine synthase
MGISRKEALDCLRSDDLIGVGMEADAVRRRLHPEGVVTYAVVGEIDYAAAMMGYGGFGSQLKVGSAHPLWDAIGETIEMGGTGVRLVQRNGTGWVYGIQFVEAAFRTVKRKFPTIWIEAVSATEVVGIAVHSGIGTCETLARLRDAGLDEIAGDDVAGFDSAVSLGNRFAPPPCSLAQWLAVHRAAHGLGMRTVATMVFGAGETPEQCVDTLAAIRQLQEETGGFTAFVPLAAEAASGRELDAVTAVEQLKTLATARVFLDNIQNIQLSGAAQGLKVLQMGLRFGANDAGSVAPLAVGAKPVGGAISGNGLMSDNGANVGGGKNATAANQPTEEDLRRIIRDAGFQPVQRDIPYRTMFLT